MVTTKDSSIDDSQKTMIRLDFHKNSTMLITS